MAYEHIEVTLENGLGTITLNRPPVNVLNIPMMEEMNEALDRLHGNKDLKAVLNRTVVGDVDHRHLNIEVPWLEGIIPTAENLARVFFERAEPELPDGVELIALTVRETERNSATYSR